MSEVSENSLDCSTCIYYYKKFLKLFLYFIDARITKVDLLLHTVDQQINGTHPTDYRSCDDISVYSLT